MKANQLAQTFFDQTVRAEQVIHIASMMADHEALPDILSDDLIHMGRVDTSEIEGLDSNETLDEEDFLQDIIVEKLQYEGFFIQLSTPTLTFLGKNPSKDSYTHSWGSYYSQWFYLKDLTELAQVAETYKNQTIERDFNEHLENQS